MRGVEDELLSAGVVLGRRFQASDKRAVAEFRLGVATEDAEVGDVLRPLASLFFVRVQLKHRRKCSGME